MQYPDNPKLVKEGKERLLEVQEVLAEREFEIGKFYYLRPSYPASIARLKTLVEKYPLYSRADEALFTLGQDYEGQIAQMRLRPTCVKTSPQPGCVNEQIKANMIEELTKEAAGAYSQIITRYPVMDREDDAKKRLAALHQPIPRPTRAALAQNRQEEESRRESTTLTRLMSVARKGPDVTTASKVGDPTLTDPTPVAANQEAVRTAREAMGLPGGGHGISVEAVGTGTPGANEPAPRSDTPAPAANADPFARSTTLADPNELKPTAPVNEAKPNGPSDPNELTPAAGTQTASADSQPIPPPVQVNEIQSGQSAAGNSAAASPDSSSSLASDKDISSSKKKKKKGLKKILTF
jgi:outer membrane protein assembly factor BamD